MSDTQDNSFIFSENGDAEIETEEINKEEPKQEEKHQEVLKVNFSSAKIERDNNPYINVSEKNDDKVEKKEDRTEKKGQIKEAEAKFVGRLANLAEKKSYSDTSDSPEMQRVKDAVEACEISIHTALKVTDIDKQLDEIERNYMVAITTCSYYYNHKNPHRDEGKKRKETVYNTLQELKSEVKAIPALRKAAKAENFEFKDEAGQLKTVIDLMGEIRAAANKAVEKKQEEKPQIQYQDFLKLVDADPRDAVEYRAGQLRLLKGGISKANKDKAYTQENKFMVKAFVDSAVKLICDNMNYTDDQKIFFSNQIANLLNTSMLEVSKPPISVANLLKAVQYVEKERSEVAYYLSHKEARNSDKAFSQVINGRLEEPTVDGKSDREQRKRVESQIKAIIRSADKNGLKMPKLTKQQMKKLLGIQINDVRDITLYVFREIYQGMCRLNGNEAVDYEKMLQDSQTVDKLMAGVIALVAAPDTASQTAADYVLNKTIRECLYRHCGKSELRNSYEKSSIQELYRDEDLGLQDLVLSRIDQVKSWKGKEDKAAAGMQSLSYMCQYLAQTRELEKTSLKTGLNRGQGEELKLLGLNMDRLMAKDSWNNIELVAKELKGTRFYDGYLKLKQVRAAMDEAKSDNYFSSAAEEIALATVRKVEDPVEREPDSYRVLEADITRQLEPLTEKEKQLMNLLFLRKSCQDYINEGKNSNEKRLRAEEIVVMNKALRAAEKDDGSKEFGFDSQKGLKVRFKKNEEGRLQVRIGNNVENKTLLIPETPAMVSRRIELQASQNLDTFKKLPGKHILSNYLNEEAANQDNNFNGNEIARKIYLNILMNKAGMDSYDFRNQTLPQLMTLARLAMCCNGDKKAVKEIIEGEQKKLANKDLLNEEEALAAIDALKKKAEKKAENKPKPVEIIQPANQVKNTDWTSDEAEFKDLVADLIFSSHTWEIDKSEYSTSKVVQLAFKNHYDLVKNLISEEEWADNLMESTFAKLNLNSSAEVKDKNGFGTTIKDAFDILRNAVQPIDNPDDKMYLINALLDSTGIKALAQKDKRLAPLVEQMNIFEFQRDIAKGLLSVKIDNTVNNMIDGLQGKITEAVNKVFDAKGDQKALGQKSLKDIISDNTKGAEGQGKFIKNVLSNYFAKADIKDKKAMIASAIRYAKPSNFVFKSAEEIKKLSGEEKKEYEAEQAKQMGSFLGAFLKGAGPLIQKTFQGLPEASLPEELNLAIKDMKSNLAPIDPEVVEAMMQQIIDSSQGRITDIKIEKPMGAATIAQAFLCRMYGPEIKEKQGKEVVIKMLRPDVKNHLAREEKFMIDTAESVGEGMKRTFLGQLEAIKKELDFRQEAENIRQGQVYNQGSDKVKAMKMVDLVESGANYLVLERAPGTTVDQYLEDLKQQQIKIDEEYRNAARESQDKGYELMERLYEMREQLKKRQRYVAELVKKWVETGIYEEGFYHGDLHAGNIMIDDNQATVIDFGNATQLTDIQRRRVMSMMSAAVMQDVDRFRHNFHRLMDDSSETVYQKKRSQLTEVLNVVMFKGEDQDVGLRIAAALFEAQKLGLELPAPVFNFSQCQIRLQNTLDSMNKAIGRLDYQMKTMACTNSDGSVTQGDVLNSLKSDITAHIATELETMREKEKKEKEGNQENKEENANKKKDVSLEEVIKDKFSQSAESEEKYLKELLKASNFKNRKWGVLATEYEIEESLSKYEAQYTKVNNKYYRPDEWEEFCNKEGNDRNVFLSPECNKALLDKIAMIKKYFPELNKDSEKANSPENTFDFTVFEQKMTKLMETDPIKEKKNFFDTVFEINQMIGKLKSLMRTQTEVGKFKVDLDVYHENMDILENLDDKGKQEVQRQKIEIIEKAKKLLSGQWETTESKICKEFFSENEGVRTRFELSFKSAFGQQDGDGMKLWQEYLALKELRDGKEGQPPKKYEEFSQEQQMQMDIFINDIYKMVLIRANRMRQLALEKPSDPASFFDVMGNVLRNRTKETLDKLGMKTSIIYGIRGKYFKYKQKQNIDPALMGEKHKVKPV